MALDKAGVYDHAITIWHNKPDIEQTWDIFITHFNLAIICSEVDLKEAACAASLRILKERNRMPQNKSWPKSTLLGTIVCKITCTSLIF